MIPLSRVLARLSDSDNNIAEPETGSTSNVNDKTPATAEGTRVSSPWNPTGNIFDLRPDLAHMPMTQLAGALLEMRRMLRSSEAVINRLQLMRFERQYSNALWRRSSAESIDTITIDGSTYRLLLTDGMDVVLLPVP